MYIYDNFVCGDLIKSLQRILATFINSREVCESLIWESMGLIENMVAIESFFRDSHHTLPIFGQNLVHIKINLGI